jgi:hypothetical protein
MTTMMTSLLSKLLQLRVKKPKQRRTERWTRPSERLPKLMVCSFFPLLLKALTSHQHKKPKKLLHQRRGVAGVSAAGSAPKRKLTWAPNPTSPSERNLEKNPALSMIPN